MLSILYLAGFFFFFCFVLMAPELFDVVTSVPTGPEQQKVAEQVARETIAPRLPIAIALSVLTVAIAGYYRRLPGMRP